MGAAATARWFRLNIPAVVFFIGWCTWFVARCTDCLQERLDLAEEQGLSVVESRRLYSAVLRYPMVLASSLSLMCYVAVSWRIPRPPQLHWHGFVLMLMVLEAWLHVRQMCLHARDDFAEGRWNQVAIYYLYGVKRIILVTLTTVNIDAVGPPSHRLLSIRLWGWILNFSQALYHFFLQPIPPLWRLSMFDRGFTRSEITRAWANLFTDVRKEVDTEAVDDVVIPASIYSILVWASWLIVARLIFALVATRLIWRTMQMLMDRKADPRLLRAVRRVLWQHVAGFWLILITGCTSSLAIIWQTITTNETQNREMPIPQPVSLAYLIDGLGDVVGALLLSGIFGLLFKPKRDGGDVSGHIRSLLHSAVLTSRGESVFEGKVMSSPRNLCIVSFPGRYWTEWNELTWFCDRGELSSACVFLPKSDPHQRFGRHDVDPAAPGGRCRCHAMYGAEKPWGCAWFAAWTANVERAVRLNLELVVVFFPQQTDQGVVEWEHLKTSHLWDGVGLGGSQKVEVAWLTMQGYRYTSQDITATKQLFDRHQTRPITPGATSGVRSNSVFHRMASALNHWGVRKAPSYVAN